MQTLQTRVVGQGPLSFEEAARMTRKIASQLSEFHSLDQLFGTVRPEVVMLLADGEPELKRSTSGDPNEEVDYLAPERALSVKKPDARSDLYSLGCTFYYLLTGRIPFPEGSVAERLLKHQVESPPDLNEICPGMPAELRDLCSQLLAKRRDHRPSSARAVAKALEQWLESSQSREELQTA